MKTYYLSVRVNEEEKKEIDFFAERENLSVSEYIRKNIFGVSKDSDPILKEIIELKKSLNGMKEKLIERQDSTYNIISNLSPYVIKSSIVTDIQMNYQDDEEMRKVYKDAYEKELSQSKKLNSQQEHLKI